MFLRAQPRSPPGAPPNFVHLTISLGAVVASATQCPCPCQLPPAAASILALAPRSHPRAQEPESTRPKRLLRTSAQSTTTTPKSSVPTAVASVECPVLIKEPVQNCIYCRTRLDTALLLLFSPGILSAVFSSKDLLAPLCH